MALAVPTVQPVVPRADATAFQGSNLTWQLVPVCLIAAGSAPAGPCLIAEIGLCMPLRR
jgi:hypothetical protein